MDMPRSGNSTIVRAAYASTEVVAPVVRPLARTGAAAAVDAVFAGLSPHSHRILELAIVRIDPAGRVLDEQGAAVPGRAACQKRATPTLLRRAAA